MSLRAATIFVCSHCHRLCFTDPEDLGIIPCSLTLDTPCHSSPDDPDFLCDACALQSLELVSAKIEFYETSRLYYDRFDITDKSVFVDTLESQVTATTTAIEHILLCSDEVMTATTTLTARPPVQRPPPSNFTAPPESPKQVTPNLSPVSFPSQTTPDEPFSSLILGVAFKIGVSGHYGTINGLRLGTNEAQDVKANEIDCALLHLGHLTVACADRAAVNTGTVLLSDHVMVKVGNKYQALSASDMYSRSRVKRFNQGLDVLMDLCHQIFESPMVSNKGLVPPFTVRVESHVVGSDDYHFRPANPSIWSRPMKFLLTNFKFLMFAGLKQAVG